MATSPPVELTVDQQALRDLARVLKDEADGKLLRRELTKALRKTADAPIGAAKAEALKIPSVGTSHGQPLRQSVASSLKPVVRLSGKTTGVSIRQTRTPGLRGFALAGRKFNRPTFRHKVYGREVWVDQKTFGNQWFDRPMQASIPDATADVSRVVQDLADTLAARARAATR